MYCPKCGTHNDDNAHKCTKCGIVIQQQPAVKKTNNAIIVVLVIAAGLLFLAVVSIFAFGIPAFMDYTVKAKIAEVTTCLDVLAEAASQYHIEHGRFPDQNYSIDGLAALPKTYGRFSCAERVSDHDITYRFTFNNALISSIDGCTLDMKVTYNPDTGYTKNRLSTSTLPKKYMPRQLGK
jgi:hypothetical protein